MSKYNTSLFQSWVPKWLQKATIIIGFIPIIMVSGVYIKNLALMVSDTQILSSYYMMAYFSSSIGLYVLYPLGIRFKRAFHSKKLVIGSLLALALLSYICGNTDNAIIFIIGSLLIGMVKYIGLFEFAIPLIQIICPSNTREKSYPILYPLLIFVSYFGSILYTQVAEIFHWDKVYLIMEIILITEALVMTLLMHNQRAMKKYPLLQIDWIGMILFTSILMGINYLLCMGAYHEWFGAPIIKKIIISIVILFAIFIYHQSRLKRPYIDLKSITKKNIIISILLSLTVGFFLASGSLLSIYIKNILGYNNFSYAVFYLTMVPGCILGGIICYHWLDQEWAIKGLILLGLACSIISNILIYFVFNPVGDISNMILPMIFKGIGMIILFISIGIYCYKDLTPLNMFSPATIFITIRSFIGVALFITLSSWTFQYLQLQNQSFLAENIDNVLWSTRSRISIYRSIRIQAILLAAKQIYGYTIIIGVMISILVSFLRFDKKV